MPKFNPDRTATSSGSESDTDIEFMGEFSAVQVSKVNSRKRPHPKESCWQSTAKKAKEENRPQNNTICALLGHLKADVSSILKKRPNRSARTQGVRSPRRIRNRRNGRRK